MKLNEYQKEAGKTAIYPGRLGTDTQVVVTPQGIPEGHYAVPIYVGGKLSGEAGEVSEKVAKALRDAPTRTISPERRESIKKELGDVLWYIAALAHDLDFTLEEVAQANLDKLAGRYKRGILHGEGDDR